jgi:ABC-type multidrug transport system fused ATPase/permease subunit
MEAFSDMMMILSVTLLAVMVAIFVLAASLLGRAIQQAREEQQEASKREKELAEAQAAQLSKAIDEVQSKLKEAAPSEAVSTLEDQLSQYKKERKASKKKSRKAARRYGRYRALTAQWGVLPTSALVLVSLVLAAAGDAVTADVAGYALLSISGSLLIGACYRIYQSLRVVQDVAVTTEETQFKREAEALEIALERHEEKKRPRLALDFRDRKPPYTFKVGAEEVITFRVRLKRGDIARHASVFFFAPEGFEFPGMPTWRQADDFTPLPNALTLQVLLGDLIAAISYTQSVTMKLPAKVGLYTVKYQPCCEGFGGEYQQFQVNLIG